MERRGPGPRVGTAMSVAIPALLNCLTLISVLALVAIGLAIVFGMMDVINLAHGEFVTAGAYTLAAVQSAALVHGLPGSFWIGLALAPLVGAGAGFLLEWSVISRLYHRPLDTILATVGISLILQKGIELWFGALPQTIYTPIPGLVSLFGVDYPGYRLFVIAVATGLIGVTLAVFRFTAFGVDLRAIIQNRTMAEALGIDARRVTRRAFAAGAALAATAGVLIAPLASVEAHLGTFFIGKAFFVVIVGGIGSILGSVAGSAFVGGSETLLNYVIDPSLASALVLLGALILVRLRPRGLVPGYSAAHDLTGRG